MTRFMQQAAAADLSRRLQLLLAFFGVPCGTVGREDQIPRPDPARDPQRSNGGRRSTPEGQEPNLDVTGTTSSTAGAAGPPAWRPHSPQHSDAWNPQPQSGYRGRNRAV